VIDRLEFGRTGHRSTRVIFGAAALARMEQERADGVFATVVEYGVNHIDTAASYGESELRLAPWLARHRGSVFLASKTGERAGGAARAQLERSLQRLGVEQLDLIQLHNLVEEDEWDTAHSRGGAVAALAQARDEGLVRFIGVTGHGLRIAGMHLRSLERFDFDSVLLPYNFALLRDERYRTDVERLFDVCAERRVAVQTIKSVARRRWGDYEGPRFSWYEPVTDSPALARAVRWVLARSGLFLNSSSDARLLRPILEAAEEASGPASSTGPTDAEMQADSEALGIEPLFDGDRLERI
jgi:aryl-alcohol dehydrogenase-like predicted oxidoreductase